MFSGTLFVSFLLLLHIRTDEVTCLSNVELESQVLSLLSAQWTLVEGRSAIKKTILFRDFSEAWGWMSRVALEFEKSDHHPEWFNVYNQVEVTWTTHDSKAITSNEVRMANFCDDVFKALNK